MKKIEKKNKKIFRGKLSKLSVSYYVLIKKSSFLGHFCVTNSQTDGRKGRVTELHVAANNNLFIKYIYSVFVYIGIGIIHALFVTSNFVHALYIRDVRSEKYYLIDVRTASRF